MPTRPVIRMGNPVLRQVAVEVHESEITTPEFQTLVQDMKETMGHEGGIGIAAPQIGISKKVAIICVEPGERYPDAPESEEYIVINPVLTVLDEELTGNWEGCLSVPGLRGYVERPRKIKLEYTDENGKRKALEAEDFMAVVFQHELDHLFGKLYIDHIKDTTKIAYLEEFEKFIYEGDEDDEDDEEYE